MQQHSHLFGAHVCFQGKNYSVLLITNVEISTRLRHFLVPMNNPILSEIIDYDYQILTLIQLKKRLFVVAKFNIIMISQ